MRDQTIDYEFPPTELRRGNDLADRPLAALHEVLQVAFGWTNSHLHDFDVSGVSTPHLARARR